MQLRELETPERLQVRRQVLAQHWQEQTPDGLQELASDWLQEELLILVHDQERWQHRPLLQVRPRLLLFQAPMHVLEHISDGEEQPFFHCQHCGPALLRVQNAQGGTDNCSRIDFLQNL